MFSGGAEVATPPFTNLAPLDVSSMERLAQNALHAGQLAQMALAGEHLTPSCVTSLIPSPKGDPTPCATLPANLNPYSLATTPATKPPPPVGGPAKRAGSGRTRRSSYTVEFKRQLVMEALRRPAGNRIRPTCAQYPGVEPCQLRKWIRALEAEVRAQPDVQMMLAALEGAPAAATRAAAAAAADHAAAPGARDRRAARRRRPPHGKVAAVGRRLRRGDAADGGRRGRPSAPRRHAARHLPSAAAVVGDENEGGLAGRAGRFDRRAVRVGGSVGHAGRRVGRRAA